MPGNGRRVGPLASLILLLGACGSAVSKPAPAQSPASEPHATVGEVYECTLPRAGTRPATCVRVPDAPLGPALPWQPEVRLVSLDSLTITVDVRAWNTGLEAIRSGGDSGAVKLVLLAESQGLPRAISRADGLLPVTAPEQPFWAYPGDLEPGAATPWRRWRVAASGSGETESLRITMIVSVPRRELLSLRAPEELPEWLSVRADAVRCTGIMMDVCRHDVVRIWFREESSLESRQVAVDWIGGELIGGTNASYVLRIPAADRGLVRMRGVLDYLKRLPQVEYALPYSLPEVILGA